MSTLRSVSPLSPLSLLSLLDGLAAQAVAWSYESQQVSRRNAMIACTALAQRRAEREDVEDYFASRVFVPHAHADAAHG